MPDARSRTLAGAALAIALAAPSSSAEEAKPSWTWWARNWTRVSAVSFFEPGPTGGDPDYGDFGNRLQAGISYKHRGFEVQAAGQYVQLAGLPDDAFGPGPLGPGAVYYQHNQETDPGSVYLKYLSLKWKHASSGFGFQVGRFGYASGSETPSGNAKIEAVKRQRVDSRLLGEFEWSMFQRSFDGARLDLDRKGYHVTVAGFFPTQGGFEKDAMEPMEDIDVESAVVALKPGHPLPGTELDLFAIRYDDDREVVARVDNTGLPPEPVDVRVETYGASLVGGWGTGRGEADALLWFAAQRGDWYGQDHSGYAVAAEGGWQWTKAPWKPWLRGGWLYASGDDTPGDEEHETFFPLLPTMRKWSMTTAYATMNLQDVFAQVSVRPTEKLVVRTDLHWLDLATGADRWYSGSGATQEEGGIFGYAGRASKGETDLGTVLEASADWALHKNWSINGYVGYMDGGAVVTGSFVDDAHVFAYLENVIRF